MGTLKNYHWHFLIYTKIERYDQLPNVSHRYHYSALLISKPAERWQRVHTLMTRSVMGKHSKHRAESEIPDIGAGGGAHHHYSHKGRETGSKAACQVLVARVGYQAAWHKSYGAVCWLPLCLAVGRPRLSVVLEALHGLCCMTEPLPWDLPDATPSDRKSLLPPTPPTAASAVKSSVATLSNEVSSPHYSST